MVFGKYSYGHPKLRWDTPGAEVKIGSFCSFGENVIIYLGNGSGHDIKNVSTYPFGEIHKSVFPNVVNKSKNTNGNVTIGNDVWIGDDVTIMSGVTIGDGVVIAANSHVVNNAAPYSIIGGNPAKEIKLRFTKDQIEKLLEIRWWDWADEKINENISYICSEKIEEFINHAMKID